MDKKNERGDAGDSRWEHHLALLPLRFIDATVKWRRPVLIHGAGQAEQKRFYEALLRLPWLAPSIRRAVMKELGRSQRSENVAFERGRALAMRLLISERKALMKKKGKRPRGGVHEAALAEIASEQGMTVTALKGRLRKKRLHP